MMPVIAITATLIVLIVLLVRRNGRDSGER